MLVGKRMFQDIITVKKEDTASYAFELMKSHGIRHLPVVDGKKLVGIVTDRDIRHAFAPQKSVFSQRVIKYKMGNFRVEEIMTPNPVFVNPKTSIEEAAQLIIQYKIGGLPVVENEELVGIITETDILKVFVEIMGIIRSSSRISVILGEAPGAFEEVSRIIKSHGVDIISVGMSAHSEKKDRVYYFRVENCNLEPLASEIQKAGYNIESMQT